ncbi:MAG TPA: SRPBCC domain-containing protein [Flavobacterium sp.]|nr:SRPBCC domain-containing protein [Flavobacterium sp.]
MEYIVHKKIVLDARPSEVWDALTNPEKTKKYFFHCKVFSDWKKGSPIVFKGKMFWIFKIELHGTIEEIEPGKFLQYTLKNESGGTETFSRVTDKLVFENGKTTLEITDDVGQGEGAEKRFKRSQKGWDKILNGLQKFIAEN